MNGTDPIQVRDSAHKALPQHMSFNMQMREREHGSKSYMLLNPYFYSVTILQNYSDGPGQTIRADMMVNTLELPAIQYNKVSFLSN